MKFLEIRKLSKIYPGATHKALDDVSFTINRQEVFALLGVNGAGKTTLSSILSTLRPQSSGELYFLGKKIDRSNVFAFRREIGLCPQFPNLHNLLTVKENLMRHATYFGLSESESLSRATKLIHSLELKKYENAGIATLSGGCRQRVLIARALMHDPQIIMLDEPTVGLDPGIRRKLWKIIQDLRDAGKTIILTTHYLEEAEFLADRVCLLHNGKVLTLETTADLKNRHENKSLEDIFLQLTYEPELED